MQLSRVLCCGLLAAVALLPACAGKRSSRDELGAKEAAASATPLSDYSAPLDLREFDVAETEDGYRGVFLKLSRLPTSVVSSSRERSAAHHCRHSGTDGHRIAGRGVCRPATRW